MPPLSFALLGNEALKENISFSIEVFPQEEISASVYRLEILFDPKALEAEEVLAGSFFKNPTVSPEQCEDIIQREPKIVYYQLADGSVKLAAGWLIEQCGPEAETSWKGFRRGDAGCHANQALVLVNYGDANGKEIFNLSEEILQSVKAKFGITLEREVNII